MTEQTKPELLSDEVLKKIEARPSVSTEQWSLHRVLITESERDALCQTVRALRQEQLEGETCELCDDPTNDEKGNPLTFLVCGRCWNANEVKNREIITALREQLAQQLDTLTSCDSVLSYIYHRERSRLLPATQEQVLDTMREVEKITRRKP